MRKNLTACCIMMIALALAGCQNDDTSGTPATGVINGDNGVDDAIDITLPGTNPDAKAKETSISPMFKGPARKLVAPNRMHMTQDGWLLVTDSKTGMVVRIDPMDLRPDQSMRVVGTPISVASRENEIYVGTRKPAVIKVFSNTGEGIDLLARQGEIGIPADLAVDTEAGLLFALDGKVGDIKVYDVVTRTLIRVICKGELLSPTSLAVNPARGEVLVTENGKRKSFGSIPSAVQIYTYTGNKVATISGGSSEISFGAPNGIATDGSRIYFADVFRKQVIVVDRDTLKLVELLGTGDAFVSDLRFPQDVVTNGAGDVYVTSKLTKSIAIFHGGTP
ncbi:MAG: hypothetical protein OEZ59_01685 [Deltaproteobacteria bacterium]|nr:hypothetical protein [Deltaproteobacteria bacterium]